MERILQDEIVIGSFRSTLDDLVREVIELRREKSERPEKERDDLTAAEDTTTTHFNCEVPEDDQAAIDQRLARARELEEKAVLEKKVTLLLGESERLNSECSKLKRENKLLHASSRDCKDEAMLHASSKSVLSTLIDTLREHQVDICSQLKSLREIKSELEGSVKRAEDSSQAHLSALRSKVSAVLNNSQVTTLPKEKSTIGEHPGEFYSPSNPRRN